MRDDDIPSSERVTARWRMTPDDLPAVRLEPEVLPWRRGEVAMAVVAIACAIVAAVVVISGVLPLLGV